MKTIFFFAIIFATLLFPSSQLHAQQNLLIIEEANSQWVITDTITVKQINDLYSLYKRLDTLYTKLSKCLDLVSRYNNETKETLAERNQVGDERFYVLLKKLDDDLIILETNIDNLKKLQNKISGEKIMDVFSQAGKINEDMDNIISFIEKK
jgi:hypothetical protein